MRYLVFKIYFAGNFPSFKDLGTQSSNSVIAIVSGCLISVAIASVVLGGSVYKRKGKCFKNKVRLVVANV